MKILFIDDELETIDHIILKCQSYGHECDKRSNSGEGIKAAILERYDVIFVDFNMPEKNGLETIDELKIKANGMPYYILLTVPDSNLALEAIEREADYISKPDIDFDKLQIKLKTIEKFQTTKINKLEFFQNEIFNFYKFDEIKIISNYLIQLSKDIIPLANNSNPLVISGENGSGKFTLSKIIWKIIGKNINFLIIDCSKPDEQIVQELFGSSDVTSNSKLGKFELYAILVFKNIELISPNTFHKVRQIIENGKYEEEKIDIKINSKKIIFLTNSEQNFISLNNIEYIRLKPLRERTEDIEPFTLYFLNESAKRLNKTIIDIEKTAMNKLKNQKWPGNLAELKSIVNNAVVICKGNVLTENDISKALNSNLFNNKIDVNNFEIPDEPFDFEKFTNQVFLKVLEKCNNKQVLTAEFLKLSKAKMVTRLKNINYKKRFKKRNSVKLKKTD